MCRHRGPTILPASLFIRVLISCPREPAPHPPLDDLPVYGAALRLSPPPGPCLHASAPWVMASWYPSLPACMFLIARPRIVPAPQNCQESCITPSRSGLVDWVLHWPSDACQSCVQTSMRVELCQRKKGLPALWARSIQQARDREFCLLECSHALERLTDRGPGCRFYWVRVTERFLPSKTNSMPITGDRWSCSSGRLRDRAGSSLTCPYGARAGR